MESGLDRRDAGKNLVKQGVSVGPRGPPVPPRVGLTLTLLLWPFSSPRWWGSDMDGAARMEPFLTASGSDAGYRNAVFPERSTAKTIAAKTFRSLTSWLLGFEPKRVP